MQADSTEFQETLVRGLTHRMNNILTVFHGYVGLMLDNQSLDQATRDGLSRIKAGAHAATELMDRTHALVRHPNLVWREVDLADLLRTMRPTIETARKPSPKIEVTAPAGLPLVRVDSGRLRTAILELVRNAADAVTGSKKGSVQIVLSRGQAEGAASEQPPVLSLAVIDNGPGISPESAPKIFEPFFSTKRKNDANGLGLSIARGLVEQCGGVLRFESKPGKTRFEILLPIHSAS